MIRTTPFHERTNALNETQLWSHWSNHLAADRYQLSDKAEYFAVRNAAGIFDSSPLYKYRISGKDVTRFLGGILARDIRACPAGHAQYTCWLDDRGFVVEDGVILHSGPEEYLLTSAEPNLALQLLLLARCCVPCHWSIVLPGSCSVVQKSPGSAPLSKFSDSPSCAPTTTSKPNAPTPERCSPRSPRLPGTEGPAGWARPFASRRAS